jgi:hypothetical protein
MKNIKGTFKWHGCEDKKWQTMTSVDELELNIEKYFMQSRKLHEVPTIQGLLLHINVNRQMYYEYTSGKVVERSNEVLRVIDLFIKAKLFIEVECLHAALDKDNAHATWYLSRFKDFSPDYNPKQEIDVNTKKELNEAEIVAELELLEQKEKELTGDGK